MTSQSPSSRTAQAAESVAGAPNQVAAAKRSPEVLHKINERTLEDGFPVISFRTLLQKLATIVCNTCVTRSAKTRAPGFQMLTTPNAHSTACDAVATADRSVVTRLTAANATSP